MKSERFEGLERVTTRAPRVIVVDRDAAFGARIATLARRLHCDVETEADTLAELVAETAGPLLAFVNIDGPEPGLLGRLTTAGQRLTVVLVTEPDTPLTRLATRLGEARHLCVADVVRKPVTDADLRLVLRRASRAAVLGPTF